MWLTGSEFFGFVASFCGVAVLPSCMESISPDVRNAVAAIVEWFDRTLEGQSTSLTEFARLLARLRAAAPFPGGQIGEDIAYLLDPDPGKSRIEGVEAIDRLRHIVRSGVSMTPMVEHPELPLT